MLTKGSSLGDPASPPGLSSLDTKVSSPPLVFMCSHGSGTDLFSKCFSPPVDHLICQGNSFCYETVRGGSRDKAAPFVSTKGSGLKEIKLSV